MLAANDVGNCRLRYAGQRRYLTDTKTVREQLMDPRRINVSVLDGLVVGPVDRAPIRATLCNAIQNILPLRGDEQVIRANASGVIASVADH